MRHNVKQLRMDMASELVFATRAKAECMEKQHAARLRVRGYAVWQN